MSGRDRTKPVPRQQQRMQNRTQAYNEGLRGTAPSHRDDPEYMASYRRGRERRKAL